MYTLRHPHWDVAYHLLRYIKSCLSQCLFFPAHSFVSHLKDYWAVDRATCSFFKKSIMDFYIFFWVIHSLVEKQRNN